MALPAASDIAQLVSDTVSSLALRPDPDEALQRLCEQVRGLVDADDVGLLLGPPDHDTRTLYVTSEHAGTAEAMQQRTDEGPCLQALRTGETQIVRSADDAASRWPRWSRTREHDLYESVLAVPFHFGADRLGTLNLLADRRDAFDEEHATAMKAVADVISVVLMLNRRVDTAQELAAQLQHALDSRVLIEQAKGILAERLHVGLDEAFRQMRQLARNNQWTLRSICEEIIGPQ